MILEESGQTGSNRTRIEILANILSVAGSGALKTRIMYRANLSHRQLERYLEFLEENGLIEVTEFTGSREYRATARGTEFLREYSHISAYFGGKKPAPR